jgi:hypothetical protein
MRRLVVSTLATALVSIALLGGSFGAVAAAATKCASETETVSHDKTQRSMDKTKAVTARNAFHAASDVVTKDVHNLRKDIKTSNGSKNHDKTAIVKDEAQLKKDMTQKNMAQQAMKAAGNQLGSDIAHFNKDNAALHECLHPKP